MIYKRSDIWKLYQKLAFYPLYYRKMKKSEKNLKNPLGLTLEYRKIVIDHFYKNINSKDILEKTIKDLKLDKNTRYWQSRIDFLKDFQAYILKNWIDQNINSIYISLHYNM